MQQIKTCLNQFKPVQTLQEPVVTGRYWLKTVKTSSNIAKIGCNRLQPI